MIQRIQTLWFALAAAAGLSMTRIPLFNATLANNTQRELFATESLLLFALVIALSLMALACVFLYKNRTLQFKFAVTGIIGSIATVALEVYFIEQFKAATPITSGTYQWGGLFPILMILFFFLASRGVYKDEKLVKSLDRLR
jgi:amino acid transporter